MLLKIKIEAHDVRVGDIIFGHKCEGPVEYVSVKDPHVMIVFKSGMPKATSINFPLTVLTEVES